MTEALSPQEVGERLRLAREAAKVTQAAAAAALDVGPSSTSFSAWRRSMGPR